MLTPRFAIFLLLPLGGCSASHGPGSNVQRAPIIGPSPTVSAAPTQPAAPPAGSLLATLASPPPASSAVEASKPVPPTAATIEAANPPARPPIDGPYQGTIGKDLRVILRIRSAGEVLTGDYFYEARGIHLKLRGTLSPTGAIAIDETNSQGKVTGHFKGQQTASGNLEGTWLSPDAARKLSFGVERMQRDLTANPVIVIKRMIRHKERAESQGPFETKPGVCEVEFSYAEVSGVPPDIASRINERLAPPSVEPCEYGYETKRGFEVTLNRNGVLSIDVGGYSMYAMGAHP